MKEKWLVGVGLVAAVLVAAFLLARPEGRDAPEGLPEDHVEMIEAPVLPDIIIVGAADASDVRPPFTTWQRAGSATGSVLSVPEGAGTKPPTGTAMLEFDTPEENTYSAWARVLWRDSCGNSLGVRVGGMPEYVVGQDHVFGTWHWVRAGHYKLPAGRHQIILTEREDGIALDQLIFTTDSDFFPLGPLTAGGRGLRRFCDNFSRSPGHGMEAWEIVSGKWNIEFALDPNRIPKQYSLRASPGGGEAIALVAGPSWDNFAFTFSVLPSAEGMVGAVIGRDRQTMISIGLDVGGAGASLVVRGPGVDERREIGDAVRAEQWHRVTVECKSGFLKVSVDGREMFVWEGPAARAGEVGLMASGGESFFDDVEVVELSVTPEDAETLRLARAFRIGPYHFSRNDIEDPSDYLDFTPEEREEIRKSPESQKLRRKRKSCPLVGRGKNTIWPIEHGTWHIRNGALVGRGANASLRYFQEISSPEILFHARMRIADENSAAGVEFYGGPDPGVFVTMGGEAGKEGGFFVDVPADGKWHRVSLHVRGGRVSAKLDGADAGDGPAQVGDGGRFTLKVLTGEVEFDDIEFVIPRSSEGGLLYAFDRRETDWLREGGKWQDHQGIACSLASNWVSLAAGNGRGLLVNKHIFEGDVTVSFNVAENSRWYGWDSDPGHVHYPSDNIVTALFLGDDPDSGYRLEVNSQERSATVLYRRGKEVARAAQDGSFPIRYGGGHIPYRPRRNRITLVRRGSCLRVVVNGREVLNYADPEPLEANRIAVGGYDTRVNFSHIEIRRGVRKKLKKLF